MNQQKVEFRFRKRYYKRGNKWWYKTWVNLAHEPEEDWVEVDLPEIPEAKGKPEYAKPKAFADPRKGGYGSEYWPFNWKKALQYAPYRQGVYNAIKSNWTDGYWKYEASKLLYWVLDQVETLEEVADNAIEAEKKPWFLP